ncbi:MAG: hypothetical protein WB779_15985 [Ignavibacteriaceae bacterium]
MKRIIKQIRNIEKIEKELVENYAGIIALQLEDDKFEQLSTPFLYKDKNVFLFFTHNDELYEDIQFDSFVSFTILKNVKVKKTRKPDFIPTYHFCATKISGLIRKVDDPKAIEELKKSYAEKYSVKTDKSELDLKVIENIAVIDTEEINAIEEIGG